MLARGLGRATFIIRPSVTAAIVYFGLCAVWFLWILCTATPLLATDPFRLISPLQYAGITVTNVTFGFLFAFDAYRSRRSPPDLRRAHFAGLALATVTAALVQLAAFRAYGPISLT